MALYGIVLRGGGGLPHRRAGPARHHGRESALARAIGRVRNGMLSALLYLAAIPLAALSVWPAVAMYVGDALLWLIADPRVERTLAYAASGRGDGRRRRRDTTG